VQRDAPLGEWQRDPAGADAELERGTGPGQVGKKVDDGTDDRRLEHVGGRLVVALRHSLAEVVLGHGRDSLKRSSPTGLDVATVSVGSTEEPACDRGSRTARALGQGGIARCPGPRRTPPRERGTVRRPRQPS
jgi:hypothetical protein